MIRSVSAGLLAACFLAGSVACGPGAAPALAAPASFDCTKAHNATERAICADAGLSARDLEIAGTIAGLLRRLDLVTAKILREDQAAFLADRNDQQGDRAGLATSLAARSAFLAAIDPAPRADFAGDWANARGRLVVRRGDAGSWTVEIDARDPGGLWTCRFTGTAKAGRPDLAAESRETAVGWTVRIVRKAGALQVSVEVPDGGKPGAPFPACTERGSVAGGYLPVK